MIPGRKRAYNANKAKRHGSEQRPVCWCQIIKAKFILPPAPLAYSLVSAAGESSAPCSYQPVVQPGWYLDVFDVSVVLFAMKCWL